jgi:hypothetical protein
MSVSITELIWQVKPRGQTIQGKRKLRSLDFPMCFYGIPLLLGTWLQFLWFPLDSNGLQKLVNDFLLRNEEVVLFIPSVNLKVPTILVRVNMRALHVIFLRYWKQIIPS